MIQIKNNRPMAMFSLFMATTTLATGASGAVTIPNEPEPTILETIVSKVTETVSVVTDGLDDEMRECGERIDAYYEKQNVPLAGYGKVFAQSAFDEGADCTIATLVAAKGMAESTGGKFTPGSGANESYNAFGWGCPPGKKCPKFESFEDAIRVVTHNLAGNNPRTAKFYKEKTVSQIINTYNPPKIVAATYGDPAWYLNRIKRIMNEIDSQDISETSNQLASK